MGCSGFLQDCCPGSNATFYTCGFHEEEVSGEVQMCTACSNILASLQHSCRSSCNILANLISILTRYQKIIKPNNDNNTNS